VIFVDGTSSNVSGSNPYDGKGQNCNGYNPCVQTYYGETSTPDKEGDAFVSGTLSGHLTIGANNDIIIDNPIKYADCTTWAGTAHQSACSYNNASTGVNDTLGLIAYNYVEISRPEDPRGNMLGYCGQSGSLAAPLCNPATKNGGGLIIDASILALQQSFILNNYTDGNNDGPLTIYGSVQQDSRGPVARLNGDGSVNTGFGKTYTWDPRLALYSPPFYLTPGTASWALSSSAESYTWTEPNCPPVAGLPTKADGSVAHPYPVYPPTVANGSATGGTGTCTAAS
jgi:hypothetical protein